jgi:hypothetical protein
MQWPTAFSGGLSWSQAFTSVIPIVNLTPLIIVLASARFEIAPRRGGLFFRTEPLARRIMIDCSGT